MRPFQDPTERPIQKRRGLFGRAAFGVFQGLSDRPLTAPGTRAYVFPAADEIRRLRAAAPVQAGQVLIEDAAGTGCAVAATGSVEKAE